MSAPHKPSDLAATVRRSIPSTGGWAGCVRKIDSRAWTSGGSTQQGAVRGVRSAPSRVDVVRLVVAASRQTPSLSEASQSSSVTSWFTTLRMEEFLV